MSVRALPVGWSRKSLEDLALVQTGMAKGKRTAQATLDIPYLRVANVQDGYVDLTVMKEIAATAADEARYALKSGDVLFTEGGDFDKLGRGTVWRGQIEPCLHQNHVFAVRPDPLTLLPEFLAAQAASSIGRHYFQACSKQSTNLASINSTQLKQFPVTLPPLPEQRKITEILRTWDEAMEKLEALRIANLKRRQWVRTEVLTAKRRLLRSSPPWKRQPLGSVLMEHGQSSTGCEAVFSVSVHKGLINQVEHLGRSFSAADTGHYNRVLPGDIVYTKSPTGEFPLGIIKQSNAPDPVIVSPLYGVFTPSTLALGTILEAWFESPVCLQNYLAPLVQKGAKNTIAITNRRFLEGELLLPVDPTEQQKIADLIAILRADAALIHDEIEALKTQKRGLMQKLLTGEWRVKVTTCTEKLDTKDIGDYNGQSHQF